MSNFPCEQITETKRKTRNLSEKKRRDAFNTLLTELASMVAANDRRLDKSNVLKQTIAFLRKSNDIPTESVSNQEIDRLRPSFLTAEEYFHLLMDATNAFLFIVNVEDGAIFYVSPNVSEKFTPKFSEEMRGKLIFDYISKDFLTYVRHRFLEFSMATDANGFENVETIGSSDFLHFTCAFGFGTVENKTSVAEFSVVGRFRKLDASLSSMAMDSREKMVRICVCLARPSTALLRNNDVISTKRLEMRNFTTRLDTDWRFLHVDASGVQMLGYQPLEILGTSIYDYCHMDDLDKLMECHEKLKTQSDGTIASYRFRTKSEKYIWIRTRCYVTYRESDSKAEFVACTNYVMAEGDTSCAVTCSYEASPSVSSTSPRATASTNWYPHGSLVAEKDSSCEYVPIMNTAVSQDHSNRQIFHPQPGVSIEHSPIPRPVQRQPPVKKSKRALVEVEEFPLSQEDNIQTSAATANEKILWDLLEKRQTNLQEKIFQHQQELRRLQEQLYRAVPFLNTAATATPSVSTLGPNEIGLISPASSLNSPSTTAVQNTSNAFPVSWPPDAFGIKCNRK